MKRTQQIWLSGSVLMVGIIIIALMSNGQPLAYGSFLASVLTPNDSTDKDDLPYPIDDRENDFVTEGDENPFDLDDPPSIIKTVEYDPVTDRYLVTEMIGDMYYRPPTYYTYEEYLEYTLQNEMRQYWETRSEAADLIEKTNLIPTIEMKEKEKEGIFGSNLIEIRPQGNIDLTIGGNFQKIDNPTLPLRQRKQGGFDFDMDINMNVIGKIGDKLQMNINYNTQATFNFDNQVKLDYSGDEDDIIQKLEAGDVSLPLPTQLIQGSQTLFGFKPELRFGRLTMTSIISQQKSKRQSIVLEGGAQTQQFEVNADRYDLNRHFFLSQFFRDNYNAALEDLPIIQSLVNITRLEVWVTNRQGTVRDIRDVVGFMDLGEPEPYSAQISSNGGLDRPRNEANNLYSRLGKDDAGRSINNIVSYLQTDIGLTPVQDFEKTFARKLNPSEYSFHPNLGFVSLNSTLNPNEVLCVAFEYTFNGEKYRVGEFAIDVPPDSSASGSKVLYLKMLKSTSIRPNLPIWDLMMKNIYSLGAFQISQEDFRLDLYYNDPGGGIKRYLPKGKLRGIPLIRLLNLDRLNNQNDAQPDGIFDFVPGVTINPARGRLIFPVVEPFGDDLRAEFEAVGEPDLAEEFVYDQLYDSTQIIAQQFPEFNRFIMRGEYKGNSSSDISLGAFNIPRGSVTVTMGGQRLVEGQHYTIDYNLGRIKIVDESVLNSGNQIKVDFENNALFGFQIKSLYGTRLDYRISDDFVIGGTIMKMTERPFTQKVNIGDDPISNTIMGLDVNYNTEAPFVTRMLDKLPFFDTKEVSTIAVSGEVAYLKPGHSKAIDVDNAGTVYLDDFEGTSNGYDLKFPALSWRLASTPVNSPGEDGIIQFEAADKINDLDYGKERAKIAWYNIDPLFQRNNSATPQYIKDNPAQYLTHYTREIRQSEVFPQRRNIDPINSNILSFDLAYYPRERGPYNFEDDPSKLNPDGTFDRPEESWGGIMRNIDNTDFEAANVEFIEFWMLDPYLIDTIATSNGNLYINLGNMSEDVLRDSRMVYENGLKRNPNEMDSTRWSRVPKIPPINNAFETDPESREYQDVGFDGVNDANEAVHFPEFFAEVQNLQSNGNLNNGAASRLLEDPSSDNYRHYREEVFDSAEATILRRYRDFNGPDGNSPIAGSDVFSSAATNQPDAEDFNRDNTLNETEEYFQYRIPIFEDMDVDNHPYIISKQENQGFTDNLNNVTYEPFTWYQFRIPIREYDNRVGSIQDFKSVQFIRMFLTDFDEDIVLRFATMELIRNQWRTYQFSLDEGIDQVQVEPEPETVFNVAAVSLEENSEKDPVNYVLPPGIEREIGFGGGGGANQVPLNEQALAMNVCNLDEGVSKAAFKNLDLDFRNYENLKMYVHAEAVVDQGTLNDGDITAFVRLGSDFKDNYYQYEIPLVVTPDGDYSQDPDNELDRRAVWPLENEFNFMLSEMIGLKQERNLQNWPLNVPFKEFTDDTSGRVLSIVGNPDLGLVKTVMLGVKNPASDDAFNPYVQLFGEDDGLPKCAELWMNELRLSGLDERGGSAAIASLDVKLADLGTMTLSGSMHTIGFGQIEQQVDDRFQDNFLQYDFATSLELGRFFPEKWGLRIPFYGSIGQTFSTPEFDPYQLDVPFKDNFEAIRTFSGDSARTYRSNVQDRITRKGFNFSNVRIVPQGKKGNKRFYDISNFNFTYAYNVIERSDPFVESDFIKNYLGSMGYNHSPSPKYLYPFKSLIKGKSKYWDIIKEINFNIFPSNLGFNTTLDRRFGELRLRTIGDEDFPIEPTFDKYFTWDRNYTFRYNPFKSLTFDFTATNRSRIDEPVGRIDTKEEKEQLWDNILKFGRNTSYNHSANINYNVPIDKIPLLDWVKVRAGYNSTYGWIAAPQETNEEGKFVDNSLGNTINNSQNIRLNNDFNFKNLYNKVEFLKTYNKNQTPKTKEEREKQKSNVLKAREKIDKDIENLKKQLEKIKTDMKKLKESENKSAEQKKQEMKTLKKDKKTIKKDIKAKKKEKRKRQLPVDPKISAVVKPLLSLKKVSVNYTENKSTTLPGYTPSTRFLGIDKETNGPGYDFIFGAQPGQKMFSKIDPNARNQFLDDAADNGWITTDTLLNYRFAQTWSKNLDIRATIEPFNDLRIDMNWSRNFSQNHTQLFKIVTEGGDFEHLNPIDIGSYTISFVSWKTLFDEIDTAGLSATYLAFEQNRRIMSDRFASENPNSTGAFIDPSDSTNIPLPGYNEGYGPTSQDVLIPAFLSAYTGKDPVTAGLNALDYIPKPNWRITYNGISKMPWAKEIFSSFTISHGYTSSLTINNFESNLDYRGDGTYFTPDSISPLNGNYHSFYRIPNIVISEQLAPLIGIDISMKNNVTTKFEWRKQRTLSMSFVDFQLSETKSTTITVGMGYRVKGLYLPLKVKGKQVRLENDLNFRFDLSIRDNVTVNHRLDQNSSEPTTGSRNISVNPSIDYTVSKRLNIRLFLDRIRTIPKTSAQFPTTNTKAGVTVRFSLAE